MGCAIYQPSNVLTIKVLPIPPIKPPNTFTPNGDGVNDTWKITGLTPYPNCLIKVFNRYGSSVYQSRGYALPWDGKGSNNRPLPDGVYYYMIIPDDKSATISGWVAIVR